MNLGELKKITRALVPEANRQSVGVDELEILIKQGAIEVASRSVCLPTSQKFASVAEKDTYNLTEKLDRYLTMSKEGVWYRTSTTTNYQQLWPATLKWFDENKRDWRDVSSGDPTHYAIDGDNLIVTPPNSTVITNAFWVYFGQAPIPMTKAAHFPFGGETEIHRLIPLQMAIVKFVEWQLVKATNKGVDNYRSKENEFEREIKKQMALINRRSDLAADKEGSMKMGGKASGF